MSTVVDRETWQNVSMGTAVILKYDPRGFETDEIVAAGQKIILTLEERKLNQDKYLDPKFDLFSNGFLAPVRLVSSAEDYQEILDNPNIISESEMTNLFKLPVGQFRERLGRITNLAAMSRIKEIAYADDSKATSPQIKAVDARLKDLAEMNLDEPVLLSGLDGGQPRTPA